ncbi:MAG: hypothetical protein ACQ9IQ_00875 [Nitrospirales bacterium]
MRHLLPFLTFFLVVNLIGCASNNYRDDLQKELDLYNNDILSQLEIGAITLSFAELHIEEEWEEKRTLLAEHLFQQQQHLNTFWDGLFSTLKFGMAIANSFVPIMPELYKLGDVALQSLKAQLTQNPTPTVPHKTFVLPPDFEHLYTANDPQIIIGAQNSQTRMAQFRTGRRFSQVP